MEHYISNQPRPRGLFASLQFFIGIKEKDLILKIIIILLLGPGAAGDRGIVVRKIMALVIGRRGKV